MGAERPRSAKGALRPLLRDRPGGAAPAQRATPKVASQGEPFATPRVFHIQYMASTENGMRLGATDAVAERCIDLAAEEGVRYFDFGTSMEDRGPRLQIGLHRFKAEFGGGGVVVESYEQELGSPAGYQLSSSA